MKEGLLNSGGFSKSREYDAKWRAKKRQEDPDYFRRKQEKDSARRRDQIAAEPDRRHHLAAYMRDYRQRKKQNTEARK